MDDFQYHAPDDLKVSNGLQILLFIATLGREWQDFHRTIQKEINTMTPQELFNQVDSALFELLHANEDKALQVNVPGKRKPELEDRIGPKKKKRFRKGFYGGKKNRNFRNSGKSTRVVANGTLAGVAWPPPRDPNATCSACGKLGHIADNCLQRIWAEAKGIVLVV